MADQKNAIGMGQTEKIHWLSSIAQWIILIFSLICLGGVIGHNLARERKLILKDEENHLLFQTQIVQQVVEKNLNAVDAVLKDLALHPSDSGAYDALNHNLTILTKALTGIRTLALLDRSGDIRASNRPELIGSNFKEREYFSTPARQTDPERTYLSKPFKTSLGAFTMNLTRMIPNSTGDFGGVVTASLDPEFFIPLLQSVLYAPDVRTTLTHGSGILFIMHPDRGNMAGTDLKVPGSFFSRHLESGKEAGVFWGQSGATGLERVLAARTINPTNLKLDHPIEITVGRDPAVILKEWRQNAYLYGIVYGCALLLCILGLIFFQRRQNRQQGQIDEAFMALGNQERFLRFLTDNIPGMVGYWDTELRCRYANKAYLEWFGRDQEQMKGITIQELMGETLFKKNEPFIRAALKDERQRFERTLTKADGRIGYTLAEYIPDVDNEQVKGFFVLVSDVTELKITQMDLEAKVQELDILAASDSLTGIANRRQLLLKIKEELERAKRYDQPLSFLMLDLDYFKEINDTHGHDVGDEVLKATAVALSGMIRSADLTGRLGGEEFGILLIQTDLEEAKQTAERLREAVKKISIPGRGQMINVRASIGVSSYSGDDDNTDKLMKRADDALYKAKNTGRDRVCCKV